MWKCTLGTSLLAAGFMVLAFAGCDQNTTQKDVASAQDKARAEERKSEQAREDAQKELAAKQQKIEESRQEAMKPVASKEEELQKTRDEQAAKIQKQDEKTARPRRRRPRPKRSSRSKRIVTPTSPALKRGSRMRTSESTCSASNRRTSKATRRRLPT